MPSYLLDIPQELRETRSWTALERNQAVGLLRTQSQAILALEHAYCTNNSFFAVLPDEKSKKGSISIESIRKGMQQLQLRPSQKNMQVEREEREKKHLRVLAIAPADRLTIPAQHALLKMLEEPPTHAAICLFSHRPETLLPTILSRLVETQQVKPSKESPEFSPFPSGFTELFSLTSRFSDRPSAIHWCEQTLKHEYSLMYQTHDASSIQKHLARLERLQKALQLLDRNLQPRVAVEAAIVYNCATHG